VSLLLDTHVVLWWLTDARELSDDPQIHRYDDVALLHV
jgi:PIN domain nuclease of toxin-antitoxin system